MIKIQDGVCVTEIVMLYQNELITLDEARKMALEDDGEVSK